MTKRMMSCLSGTALAILLCLTLFVDAVSAAPTLVNVLPKTVAPGMKVTIIGSGFGSAQGSGVVRFGTIAVTTVITWSDTKIVLAVPPNVVAGNLTVVQNGVASGGIAYEVKSPETVTGR